MARLAIAKGFLTEYAKLDRNVQSSVEAAISKFAQHAHVGIHLEKLRCLLFVACTRARDHLYVSYTGEPSRFLNA